MECLSHMPLVFYIFLILTILWFILMTCLSHQDGEHTGRTSYGLAERLSAHIHSVDVDDVNGKLRRSAHIIVFAVFTILLGLTLWAGELPMWWITVVIGWSYIDEATKPLIEGRHFSWFDVGLNLVVYYA